MIRSTSLLLLTLLLTSSCNNVLGDKTSISSDLEDPIDLTEATGIKIVSAPGGAGTEVDTLALNDNENTTLYAISINVNGDYLEDVSVNWSVANNLGAFSASTGSSTQFTPNAGEGNEIVTASHAHLGTDSTGQIDITFTVSSLSDLEAWYKADYGVTYDGSNSVTTWSDLSTNGNNASQPGASSLKPNFVSSAINGLPALRFDGSNDFLTTTSSIVSGTSGRTIFIVAANISNTGTYNALMDLSDTVTTSGTNYGITTEVAVRISGNRVFNEGIAAGETKVLTITNASGANSTGIETYLDGIQSTQASASTQTINTLTRPAYIGMAAFSSSNCHCDIAEVIVYNSLLPFADRQAVETYLANKYGL